MTSDPGAADPADQRPGGVPVGPFAPLERLVGRLLGWGPVPAVTGVLDAYGRAGGGLLAAGLAFGAIFALIPATLLVVGVAGFFVADPAVRDELVASIAAQVPPLEPFVTLALDQLAAGAVAVSIVGLVGFAWTASQFYGQLDHAFALIFGASRHRDMVERTMRGLVVVGLVIAMFMVLLWTSTASSGWDAPILGTIERILRAASPVVAWGLATGTVAFVYRLVPTRLVPWPAALLPAAVVALLEIALTTLFVLVAPYLASPKIFGPFFTVFAALAWLSWTFQILLIGAAWVCRRATSVSAARDGRAPGGAGGPPA